MKAWMREAGLWVFGLLLAAMVGGALGGVLARDRGISTVTVVAASPDVACGTSPSDDECYECTQCQAGARTIVVCQNVCEPEQETLHQEPRGFRL